MKTYKSQWWAITFPDDWQAEDGESALAIFSEQGVGGVVQISASRNSNGPVTDADLRKFAREHLDAGVRTKNVTCGDFIGFYFHFGTEDTYQRQWWLRHGDTMVLVTYTSAPEHKGQEESVVDGIVATLRKR